MDSRAVTELSFLLDLILNHKLPKATKDAVAARIKDVEAGYSVRAPIPQMARPMAVPPGMEGQAPSTIAAMMRHGTGAPNPIDVHAASVAEQTVAIIAQTPAAAAAMNARAQAIQAATGGGPFTGKPEKGRTSPRKF